MAGDTLDQAKTKVTDAVDRLADDLEKISHQIHATPELCFHEEQAAGWLSAFLERQGARVERAVGGLPTAFRATIEGSGPGPTIAIMAEYDAPPNIANAAQCRRHRRDGAGAAIAAARQDSLRGSHQVIGTPAEEGGAGR
jgi:metal-dependent amidase/aminoacylase/carboxypeptidase family protein